MKSRFRLLSVLGIASLAGSLSADTLTGPGGAWQSWSAATLGPSNSPTYGGAYWNNFSSSGASANIGWCMTGTGSGCVVKSPSSAISYYGNGNSASQNMSFQSQGVPITVSLVGLNTAQTGGNNGTDYFGWYSINSNGTIGAMTQLWNSSEPANSASTSATFNPAAGGKYGFYLENVQSPGKSYQADYFWFMNTSYDYASGTGSVSPGLQHFSAFTSDPNGSFYLGIDDSRGSGPMDYNELIVHVQNGVPEPSSFLLLGGGLAICGLMVRKVRTHVG